MNPSDIVKERRKGCACARHMLGPGICAECSDEMILALLKELDSFKCIRRLDSEIVENDGDASQRDTTFPIHGRCKLDSGDVLSEQLRDCVTKWPAA